MSQPIDQVLLQKMEEYKNIKQILIEITTDALDIYFNEKSSLEPKKQLLKALKQIEKYLDKIVTFEITYIKLLKMDGFKYMSLSNYKDLKLAYDDHIVLMGATNK